MDHSRQNGVVRAAGRRQQGSDSARYNGIVAEEEGRGTGCRQNGTAAEEIGFNGSYRCRTGVVGEDDGGIIGRPGDCLIVHVLTGDPDLSKECIPGR